MRDQMRHYDNAPIIEAVIHVGFSPIADFDSSELQESLLKHCSSEYPKANKEFQNEFRFQSGEHPQSHSKTSEIGLTFNGIDRRKIFKIQRDKFIFSWLKPYEDWTVFQKEAKDLFLLCCKHLPIENVSRTSVRFINRFDIPEDTIELADYFNVYPQLFKDEKIRSLAMQVVLDQPDIESTLIINQAVIPPLKSNTISILLDFDLFNEQKRELSQLWE